VRVISFILRIAGYLYQLVLTGFLLGVSGIALLDGVHNLRLDMLPWTGRALTLWLFGSSLAGLAALVLAITGRFRWLFPAWCLAVLVMMVRGYFFSGYGYQDMDHFLRAVYLTLGALAALLGSLAGLRRRPSRRR